MDVDFFLIAFPLQDTSRYSFGIVERRIETTPKRGQCQNYPGTYFDPILLSRWAARFRQSQIAGLILPTHFFLIIALQ